jgi:hypothetical protein
MSLDTLRLIEHVHGHLAWLAVALLFHPAIVLRRPSRRAHLHAHWAVGLSTALLTLASSIGLYIYVAYRDQLKQRIFQEAPRIGLLFERKEHLAFGSVMLAWAGCIAYFAATRSPSSLQPTLRTMAFRAYVGAASLALLVAVLGTFVAVY